MTAYVLDSSAVLALLFHEKGEDIVGLHAPHGLISTVNIAEIVTRCISRDFPEDAAFHYIENSNIRVVDFDSELATVAGQIYRHAPKGILSLGDRACIATAIRMNATALTADRIWATLDLGCPVELIR